MGIKREFNNVAQLVRTSRAAIEPKLSQAGLAALVGYSCGNYISSIERGASDIPDKSIRAYADALGVTFQQIINAKQRDFADFFDCLAANHRAGELRDNTANDSNKEG